MFHFKPFTANRKLGPIPASMTDASSCPDTCPFKGAGCYAETGFTRLHWRNCSLSQTEFLRKVKSIPRGALWRHNVAGELLNDGSNVDISFLNALDSANCGKKGFTYTHLLPNPHNLKAFKSVDFVINLSANNPAEAVGYTRHGLPVVTVVNSEETNNFKYKGKQFIICPAAKHEGMTCQKCGLCAKPDRNCIVAFPSHGVRKKVVDKRTPKV
jgi:hypothetical protein